MILWKKYLFGIFFLTAFAGFHFSFTPFFTSYDWVFGLGTATLRMIFGAAFLLLMSGVFFAIFAAMSQDIKLGAPIILLGALVPFAFSQNMLSAVLAGGFLITLLLFYLLITKHMSSYITFSPKQIFSSDIKTVTTLLVIIISIGFYLSINQVIKAKGFAIPESIIPDILIESVIRAQMQQSSFKGERYLAQAPFNVTPEQLELLKQNPEVMKQYGVTPEMLEQVEKSLPASNQPKSEQTDQSLPESSDSESDLTNPGLDFQVGAIKSLVLNLLNGLAKDYQFIVAPFLAAAVWSLFAFANFFLYLLVNPILWLIFTILEKTNFIHFERQMREVKKLVIS